ncbi:MAG: tetratricopeptide repeat protein [Flavobacteriales bacterium]|nr:tetratricopeptide repeat protein [Flavobacteriales bacterium]
MACSTKKNSFTRRAYHNTTTRYNYYFNAKEIMKATNQKLLDEHVDDFSELIPLFILPNEEKSKSLYPDMDKAIEKCSEAIDRHSIYVKKEEHNRWVDDCYMIIGKARVNKHERYLAIEIFEYLAKAYNKKPEKYLALIWLARTHMELNEMSKAEVYLKLMDEGKAPPDKFKSEYNAVYADFFIRKKQYDDAIAKLEEALKTTKNRKEKQRFNYVLAQLWLKKKEFSKASELFTKVIDLKPRYDMLFNAQISRALSFDVEGKDNDDVKKMLTKMMKDAKNKEFLDQIYYALADIAFKQNDEPLGIEYLKKSAWASVGNQKQKALSYLRLGELYYAKPKYVPAQMYYDSCMTFLPETYNDYDNIYSRTKALGELVENINIVQTEDSLQKMATDLDYRKQSIEQLIANEILAEQKQAELEALQANNAGIPNNTATGINATSNGKWYFYNSTIIGFGYNDFVKNWGNRKLEDNWRRANKQASINFDEELTTVGNDSTISDSIVINEKTDPDYYLQFLPLDEKKMNVSHNKIIEALYALGNIYREDFMDYEQSVLSFEDLLVRYDTCRYVLPTWYNLYRISLTTNNDPMREKYMRLIIQNYPESEYARIIQDPTYNKATREGRKRVDNYYSIIFDLYKEGKYSLVMTRVDKSRSIFADNHLQDKFDFLEALAIGQVSPVDTFKTALETVIKNHSASPVAAEAKTILDKINQGVGKTTSSNSASSVEKYSYKPDDVYTFIAIIPSNDNNTNKYKVDISNFNTTFYQNETFNVSSIFLNGLNQIITVKEFKNEDAAKDYYQSFKFNQEHLSEINAKGYQYFIISNDNFVIFYKDKNIPDYLNFFTKQFGLN